MKRLGVGPVEVNAESLAEAFDKVFGADTLRAVHGETTAVAVQGGTRTVSFRADLPGVPAVLRRFVGGSVPVTAHQRVERGATRWTVTSAMDLGALGGVCSIEPKFWVESDERGGVVLAGSVSHHARLPRPLKGLAEAFMVRRSERELRHFGECLKAAGALR